jgi:hypothetical protein
MTTKKNAELVAELRWLSEHYAGQPKALLEEAAALLAEDSAPELAKSGMATDPSGEPFQVEIVEVMQALVAYEKSFGLWCEHFLKPYLLEGKAVAVKVLQTTPV